MTSPASDHHPPPQALDLIWLQSDELLAITDASGRLLQTNPRFDQVIGPARRDGTTILELLGENRQHARWRAHIEGTLDGSVATSEPIGLAGADGKTAWVRARGTRLALGPTPAWLWQMPVITELREAQASASRSAELLELVQAFGRMGIWQRDPQSGEGEWDEHMFQLFGYDTAGPTPNFKTASLRVHPDDQEPTRRAFEASLRQPGRYQFRVRILHPDGSLRVGQSMWNVHETKAGEQQRVLGVILDDTAAYELAQSVSATTALLKLAADLGQISVWRHDLKTGRYYLNDHAYAIGGIAPRPEGLSSDELREMIHPDDRLRVAAATEQALVTNRPTDWQARYRRGNEWRQVMARRVVQRDAKGEPVAFVGVALDVTDQLAESRRAAETARQLELAASAAGMGIWFHEPQSDRLQWNTQMYELCSRDQALGPPGPTEWIETLIHPEDRARARLAHAALDRGTQSRVDAEYRVLRADGEIQWLALRARREIVDGRVLVFGVCFDVTERIQAEAALRNANEQVALAARGAGIGTWERGEDPASMVWDAQMFRLRGLEPAARAPTYDEIYALVHPDDLPSAPPITAPDFLSAPPTVAEFRVRLPDGTYRWLASRSASIADDQGRVVRRVGVNWDITDAKNAATARQEREIAHRESQAKSRFLARMSHELRTPLNAVLGFAQLLTIESASLNETQRGRIGHIRSAGEHLLALIDDVLDLSSLESGDIRLALEPVDVARVVDEALVLLQAQACDMAVTVQPGPVGGTVLADRTRLRQVLVNLLSNAIKYNRAGGQVGIETRVIGNQQAIRVTDTGRGLSAEQREHLFEPFNRLGVEREGIEGTGIGLAIVKALVERMQGSMQVASEPGRGSVFEVRLPAADPVGAAEPVHAPQTGPQRPASAHDGCLLYIEDNAVNVMLVEELVRSFTGLSIVSEVNGLAGVSRAQSLLPDLILVDMQLPDIDGFEVLRRLRADPRTAAIRCLALSANAMPEDIARARAAGFEDYWTKPIDVDRFLEALAGLF
jgi:PAS domain S-box-containing protein